MPLRLRSAPRRESPRVLAVSLVAVAAVALLAPLLGAASASAQSGSTAPQGSEQGEFDRLIQNDPSLQPRADGTAGVAEDRGFYRTSRPRSPKALGFGASPTDPYRDRPSRPGLIYDEVLQTFRSPFEPDR